MAFKRNIARLPIIPADATKHNVTCHYCIVGCGYNAYTWPINKQGGTAPNENALGVDLSKQQPADSEAWYAPSMYNVVKQNGRTCISSSSPKECSVNSDSDQCAARAWPKIAFRQDRQQQHRSKSRWSGVTALATDKLGRRS